VFGLISVFPTIRYVGSALGAIHELLVGLGFVLVYGLVFGFVVGLITSGLTATIETRTIPNQGIRRSAQNAVPFGLLGWLVGDLCGLRVYSLAYGDWTAGLNLGVFYGPVIGSFVGLVTGGQPCILHFVLRLWLIRNVSIPWNFARFLDHAAERILLRKVGGGYIFIHRMLLEYFAARYDESSAEAIPNAEP